MDYILERQSITYSSYEAEQKRYKKVIGKSGRTWLYAIQDNPADNIYVSASKEELKPGYRGFKGFGGATLSFTLKDGTIEKLKGAWHTNSDALYHNTDIDLRNKHLTFVVISKNRKSIQTEKEYTFLMVSVLYKDEKPIIGKFDRGQKLAQKIANKLQQTVYCYSQSQGGSSNSPIEPKE